MIHAGLRYAFSPIPSCLDKTAFILVSWRCWIYLPVTGPRFLLFGRRVGVTLARYSYFPCTFKNPSTFSLQRYYLKTLPLTSCSIFEGFICTHNDTVAASVDCTKFGTQCVYTHNCSTQVRYRYGYSCTYLNLGTYL